MCVCVCFFSLCIYSYPDKAKTVIDAPCKGCGHLDIASSKLPLSPYLTMCPTGKMPCEVLPPTELPANPETKRVTFSVLPGALNNISDFSAGVFLCPLVLSCTSRAGGCWTSWDRHGGLLGVWTHTKLFLPRDFQAVPVIYLLTHNSNRRNLS